MIISTISWDKLVEYLVSHESDIAHGINDFGGLRKLFVEVMGRVPFGNLPLSNLK